MTRRFALICLVLSCLTVVPTASAQEFHDLLTDPEPQRPRPPRGRERTFYYEVNLEHAVSVSMDDTLVVKVTVINPGRIGQTMRGAPVSENGRLSPGGKWRLTVEKMELDQVIGRREIPSRDEEPARLMLDPLATKTWIGRLGVGNLVTAGGRYRLRLSYEDSRGVGREFHVSKEFKKVFARFVPERTSFFVGEPIPLRFLLRNGGVDRFYYLPPKLPMGQSVSESFAFRVPGAKPAAAEPVTDAYVITADLRPAVLKAGDQFTQPVSLLDYVHFREPGRYAVNSWHALGFGTYQPAAEGIGWNYREAGTVTLELRPPAPAQARQLIQRLLTEKRLRPFAALCHPNYLPLLHELVQGETNNLKIQAGLAGIGSVHSPAATRLLLKLARDPRDAVRIPALGRLTARLPDPRDTGHLPPDARFLHETDPRRRKAALRMWDKSLRSAVIEVGVKALGSEDLTEIALGSTCLLYMGAHEKLDLLRQVVRQIGLSAPPGRRRALCLDQIEMHARYLYEMAGKEYEPLRDERLRLEREEAP